MRPGGGSFLIVCLSGVAGLLRMRVLRCRQSNHIIFFIFIFDWAEGAQVLDSVDKDRETGIRHSPTYRRAVFLSLPKDNAVQPRLQQPAPQESHIVMYNWNVVRNWD
jgi:hypothetical protein